MLNRAALSAACTQRLEELSKSRSVNEGFQFSRTLPDIVAPAAKAIEPSSRIIELSKPKSAMIK